LPDATVSGEVPA